MRLGVESALVDGVFVPGDVEVENGRITGLGLAGSGTGIAAPGLIDLQVNGFGGIDFLDADPEGYATAGEALLETGVTAYLPTFITSPEEQVIEALGVVAALNGPGPRVLGAHLEGPFLSSRRLGVHRADWRRDPDLELLDRLLAAGPVRLVTLAPELHGSEALIDRLLGAGIVVSLGHTDATAVEAHAAFDSRRADRDTPLQRDATPRASRSRRRRRSAGDAGHRTSGHRRPDPRCGRRSPHRARVRARTARARDRRDGRRCSGRRHVRARRRRGDGDRRHCHARQDGTLAGSVLTLIEAVRNLHELGAPLELALTAASAHPASVVGAHELGRLTIGGPADIVVLDDRLELRRVLVGGEERVAG